MIDHPMMREELVRSRLAERLEKAEKERFAALAATPDSRPPGHARRLVGNGAGIVQRRLRVLRWLAGTVAS